MRITTSNVEYARTQTHVLERCRGIHHSDHTKALKHQIIWCIQDIGPTNCLYKISFRFLSTISDFFGLNNWSDRSFVYKWCENYPKSPYDTQWARRPYPPREWFRPCLRHASPIVAFDSVRDCGSLLASIKW